jgi:hypothetical protein
MENTINTASPITPQSLGLFRTLEMVRAPKDRSFFYRGMDKRIIEVGFTDERWLDREPGPTIYAVTDQSGTIRYVGKHEANTPLRSRWFRHGHIHHQQSSRTFYIAELDAGRGPLTLWSAPVHTLLLRLSPAARSMSPKALVAELEAAWIARLRPQLWNKQRPTPSFSGDLGCLP